MILFRVLFVLDSAFAKIQPTFYSKVSISYSIPPMAPHFHVPPVYTLLNFQGPPQSNFRLPVQQNLPLLNTMDPAALFKPQSTLWSTFYFQSPNVLCLFPFLLSESSSILQNPQISLTIPEAPKELIKCTSFDNALLMVSDFFMHFSLALLL